MDTHSLPGAVLAASTVTTIGAIIAVLVGIGAIVFLVANLRASRPEIGSEIELAPNRKPYLTDEELETTRLNRTLQWALVLLVICSVGVPLYWLAEPGRQSGAIEQFESVFASRGEERYVEGSQCQNCHGPEGTGGLAAYTITDADGEFVATVQWRAPALNTVLLRFSRDEVTYILNYGRPFSPMVGWGAEVNKGPLNEQQEQFVGVIRGNVERMAVLVSDLADIARIESGRLKVEIESVELRSCVREALNSLRGQFEARQQTFTQEIAPDLPRLRTDFTPLSRRRKTRPVWVSAGTRISASPPRVGTRTASPSAACEKRIGTSQCRSSPSRSKIGCGRTRTSTYRSPGDEPAGPASPSPARRMRSPLSTPAGIFTESTFSSSTRPLP